MDKGIEKVIIDVVSDHFGVTRKAIRSHSRHPRTARDNLARQIVMYALHKYVGYSQYETARVLSYSSHGSVIHAVKKIEDEMEWNANIRQCLNVLDGVCRQHLDDMRTAEYESWH